MFWSDHTDRIEILERQVDNLSYDLRRSEERFIALLKHLDLGLIRVREKDYVKIVPNTKTGGI